MATPELDVRINKWELVEREWRIAYTLTSKSTAPVFLVQHQRLPFLRLTSDGTTIEIWLGVPPAKLSEIGLINVLILPDTLELGPGAVVNKTVIVKLPLKQSGYWLKESEETPFPLEKRTEMKAVIVQGFGLTPLSPQRVRSIDQLFAWQSTVRSQVITLKLPP